MHQTAFRCSRRIAGCPPRRASHGAAGRRRRASGRGLPRVSPLPLPARPPPLPPLRHLHHSQPTLPLLSPLVPGSQHAHLHRYLVAGRVGRRPLRPPRGVRLRVRAVLRLPPAPPRFPRAPRTIPIRSSSADARVQSSARALRLCPQHRIRCCRGLLLQIVCANFEGPESSLPSICSLLFQPCFCVLLIIALLQAYDVTVQKKRPLLAMQALVIGALRSIFIFVPFFAFQAYGYLNICVHGSSEELRPWCKAKVPLLYGFIQSHYWGVGFLRYFQVKQLPNFLLASPVLSLAVYSIVHYTKLLHRLFQTSSIHKQIITALEESSVVSYRRSNDVTVLSEPSGLTKKAQGNSMLKQRKSVSTETASATFHDTMSTNQNMEGNQDACSILLLPFVLHLVFMTFTAFFVMHVQVSTRFLSASPPIYWAAAHIFASPSRSSKRWGYLICVYFIAYILLGCLLFSNFYPFT